MIGDRRGFMPPQLKTDKREHYPITYFDNLDHYLAKNNNINNYRIRASEKKKTIKD